jgi:hypothetical protein
MEDSEKKGKGRLWYGILTTRGIEKERDEQLFPRKLI